MHRCNFLLPFVDALVYTRKTTGVKSIHRRWHDLLSPEAPVAVAASSHDSPRGGDRLCDEGVCRHRDGGGGSSLGHHEGNRLPALRIEGGALPRRARWRRTESEV